MLIVKEKDLIDGKDYKEKESNNTPFYSYIDYGRSGD
jgi:hypothetical protein